MKKLLLLLSCVVMVFAAHAQQPSQENTSYTLDPQATAAAPWKVGEMIAEEPCFVLNETTCYFKFLGITTQGKALLQEFYASEQKATEPYTAIVLPETGERRRDGLYTMLHENGQKMMEGYYQDGKRQGLWPIWWYGDGAKHSEGYYQDGKIQRLSAFWHDDQKMSEDHYQDDKMQGLSTRWHENGQKAREGHYQDNKKQGLWTWWHDNGQKSQEGYYQDDKPQGLWTWWDKNGNIIEKRNFD